MNPVNKLLSAMLVDRFKVPMKWRGNIIVLSVKKGKTCNFTGTAEEMKRVKDAVTRFAAHLYIPMPFGSSFPGYVQAFMGQRYARVHRHICEHGEKRV